LFMGNMLSVFGVAWYWFLIFIMLGFLLHTTI
jgi:hypothetical protein